MSDLSPLSGVKRRGPPSQGWKTFLHNHADGIAAMDMFVVPTISFPRAARITTGAHELGCECLRNLRQPVVY
jgi:hypothetical protein